MSETAKRPASTGRLLPVWRGYAVAIAILTATTIALIGLSRGGPAVANPLPAAVYVLLAVIYVSSLLVVVAIAGRARRPTARTSTAGEPRDLRDLATAILAPFSTADDSDETELRIAQAQHALDQLGTMMAINIVNAVLVAWTIQSSVDRWQLAVWLTLVVLAAVAGLVARRRALLRATAAEPRPVSKRTLRRISLHAGLRGLLWGACFAMFFADAGPIGQLILLSVALGMMAGGIPALAPAPSAALLFGLGIAAPTILRLVSNAGTGHLVLALFGIAFSGSMAMVAAQLYRNFARNLIARRAEKEHAATISLLLNELESSASDWLWEADAEGRLVRAPARMFELFGCDAAVGEVTLSDCLSRSAGAGRLAIAGHMAEGKGYRDIVLRTGTLSGEQRWVSLTASPRSDGGWRGVGSDVTAEKLAREQAAEALRRAGDAEQRLSDAIDALGAGFVLTDAMDRTIVVNKRFARMFPAGARRGVGTGFEELLHTQSEIWTPRIGAAESEPTWLVDVIARRRACPSLFDVRLPDESWLRVEATPTSEGGIVTVLTDISDIKQQEAELEAQTDRLAQSNRDLQQFAAIASHDLQEPLRKIEAFGGRLERRAGKALDEESAGYLRRMTDATGRMRRLVTDLLAFSRIAQAPKAATAVALDRVVADVLDDLSIRIEEKGAEVCVAELGEVAGDATLLRQLMQNLIGNALKFTRSGVTPRLDVSQVRLADGRIEIRIRDNGIGFDMKHHAQMFEIFQRLHSRDAYEGSGIGLATCRRIVGWHGGTIRAESAPGEGSTFIVTLPAAAPAGQHADRSESASATAA